MQNKAALKASQAAATVLRFWLLTTTSSTCTRLKKCCAHLNSMLTERAMDKKLIKWLKSLSSVVPTELFLWTKTCLLWMAWSRPGWLSRFSTRTWKNIPTALMLGRSQLLLWLQTIQRKSARHVCNQACRNSFANRLTCKNSEESSSRYLGE